MFFFCRYSSCCTTSNSGSLLSFWWDRNRYGIATGIVSAHEGHSFVVGSSVFYCLRLRAWKESQHLLLCNQQHYDSMWSSILQHQQEDIHLLHLNVPPKLELRAVTVLRQMACFSETRHFFKILDSQHIKYFFKTGIQAVSCSGIAVPTTKSLAGPSTSFENDITRKPLQSLD